MSSIQFLTIAIASLFFSCGSPSTTNNTTMEAQPTTYVDLEVDAFIAIAQNDKNGVILDVRTPEETKEGMIPGAVEIDFRDANFETNIETLDKSRTYYVYCRSGGRSVSACEVMNQKGFNSLYNMLGGYNAYKASLKE